MKPLVDCRLYAFIDTACLQGRAPELVAQQLCDGGADLIQLRAKNSTPDEVRRMAEAIQPITKRANIGLVINDHVDIANELETEFCHLGQEDFFGAGYKNVSELKGRDGSPSRPLWKGGTSVGRPGGATLPEVRIGLSTHSPEQAKRALAAGADYIAIGPVYATGTKPTAKPVTLEYVRWAAAPQNGVDIPWFAIGGINLENLDDVLAAGAKRICVVSAILNAPNVAKACAEFRRRLED
ncbi:MAG: thiamine phosphate synthase [Verrucomicrobiota bacterium]|jgi:thiamine-phosphate pyrophosphorylase